MKRKRVHTSHAPISWLPVDSRLVYPLFSFGRVRGIARVFLTIEMTLAVCVVVGTLAMVVLRIKG
jgi:hypothetical protein